MNRSFDDIALADYLYWQKTDKKIFKRINRLLDDIEKDPFHGIGKPEPLSGDYKGRWSRRINQKDRITYRVDADKIVIMSMRGHYPQK